jgi:hypothetical protein
MLRGAWRFLMKLKTIILSCASVIALVAGSVAMLYGQAPEKGTKGEETLTGCLNKGPTSSEYTFTDQRTGNEITVTGPSDLEKHSTNHTVRLTGKMTSEGGKRMFDVTKIEHVSATCQPSTKKKG